MNLTLNMTEGKAGGGAGGWHWKGYPTRALLYGAPLRHPVTAFRYGHYGYSDLCKLVFVASLSDRFVVQVVPRFSIAT